VFGACWALKEICRLMDSNPYAYIVDGQDWRAYFERRELKRWLNKEYR